MDDIQFAHLGITCDDPLKVEAFYTEHFGFERANVFDNKGVDIVMLKKGDFYLELFQAKEKSPLPPPERDGYPFRGLRHLSFSVKNLDAALARLEGIAPVTLGPLELDDFVPGMRIAWIADPEGNIVELNEGYRDR